MTLAIDSNDPAIRAHAEAYRQASSAKRRQALIGIAVFIACVLLSARGDEDGDADQGLSLIHI